MGETRLILILDPGSLPRTPRFNISSPSSQDSFWGGNYVHKPRLDRRLILGRWNWNQGCGLDPVGSSTKVGEVFRLAISSNPMNER
ncbi:hypothetical protein AMTR_s00172p00032970 [Amborella trichopoda]|uniref:Uncharacterized protein n=1 Tax=Amborella trichopoda TaxID=13333 RepID=W1PS52_AMBTC|nr:hypothetical protein AMTR_s00172p00032970 [Amborella trichopoda]